MTTLSITSCSRDIDSLPIINTNVVVDLVYLRRHPGTLVLWSKDGYPAASYYDMFPKGNSLIAEVFRSNFGDGYIAYSTYAANTGKPKHKHTPANPFFDDLLYELKRQLTTARSVGESYWM